MGEYKAPLTDIKFAFNDVLKMPAHYAALGKYEDATQDLIDAIIEEGAKFAERELSPLNQSGDTEGCTLENGAVTTPTGFKAAYDTYVANGWPSLSHSTQYGGQGLPESLGIVGSEMNGSANWSWTMYPGLSHGAMNTLVEHGTEEQRETFLTRLVSGEWTGTMCLTEPHCGTDLGLLRTRAEPQEDGSYKITGNKIFISAGDHDFVDNIIHIVLARLPDAPEGVKGISLFIVPKVEVNSDGSLGERNAVTCGSLEHKMGIHGNATAALNFDAATGYLIGEANKGLMCMFTFMNTARIGTAVQGVAHAEWGFQNSLAYARDRLQMRALTGTKAPDKAADPIIVHPDVRRMLLTQKAFAEGGRVLVYFLTQQNDLAHEAKDETAKVKADHLLQLLTPIAKAFLTEAGCESASLGMQCFGGHGYIHEWGMEQNVRDARISTLYEGTTGIQALDLVGRKVLLNKGKSFKVFCAEINAFLKESKGTAASEFRWPLRKALWEWQYLTLRMMAASAKNKDMVGSASVDYLMYSGYVVLAYMWARSAMVAGQKLEAGEGDPEFYKAKLDTARFYYAKLLPRTRSLKTTVLNGPDTLMAMEEQNFQL